MSSALCPVRCDIFAESCGDLKALPLYRARALVSRAPLARFARFARLPTQQQVANGLLTEEDIRIK